MFFKEKYKVNNVFNDYDENIINKTLKENEVHLNLRQGLSEEWAGYSVHYALSKGLDIFRSMSFGSMVSGVVTGLPVSASTEYYFKEEKIFDEALKFINEMRKVEGEDVDEKQVIRGVFLYLFKLYRDGIRKYEYLNKQVTLRLSSRQLDKVQTVEGESLSEKIGYIIDHFED